MASVFKRTRDRKKKNVKYLISYVNDNGKRRMKTGFTDKGLSEQLAAKLENEVRLRKTGMIDPILEAQAKHRSTDINIYLEEFKDSLIRKLNTEKHVKLTASRVGRIITACGFKTLGDIDPEVVERYLAELRKDKGYGLRTINHFAQTIEQYCRWLTHSRLIAMNPIPKLSRQREATDVRRKRRSLTTEEIKRLIEAAEKSRDVVQCYDGKIRALIYLLAYFTGLRRRELAYLTSDSFNFDSTPPTLTVSACVSKHRKQDTLPVHPQLISVLQEFISTLVPGEFFFPKLEGRRTWKMVKHDLSAAGLPDVTKDGVADFHALRHTYITQLILNGASLPEAMKLARHSDIKMTMKYTHIGLEDQAKALTALPDPRQYIVVST